MFNEYMRIYLMNMNKLLNVLGSLICLFNVINEFNGYV